MGCEFSNDGGKQADEEDGNGHGHDAWAAWPGAAGELCSAVSF